MRASGVVAFFDILGYKSFLRHCPCDEAAALVVNIIAGAEDAVVSHITRTAAGAGDAALLIQHVRTITWVVFSDTLLLLCPFDESLSSADVVRRWYAVILSAQVLSKHMFEEGLPLRGCISYGQFIHEKNCFAGKTILEAYEFAEALPFAATVIQPAAFDALQGAAEPYALRQDLTAKLLLMASFAEYGVEVKEAVRQLQTLNFLVVTGIARVPSAWIGNCREIVLRSFTRHHKTLGEKELAKAENTTTFLAFLERRFPGTLRDAQ